MYTIFYAAVDYCVFFVKQECASLYPKLSFTFDVNVDNNFTLYCAYICAIGERIS